MLELAQQKLGKTRLQYQQADLFQWEPEREYNLIFFANWLSHISPQTCGAFLRNVARAVRPGGMVAILDQSAPMAEDRPLIKEGTERMVYVQRTLGNGTTFICKSLFCEAKILQLNG